MAPVSWNSKEDILEVGEYHGSIQEATKRFKDIFYVGKLSNISPFVLMTIEHISPTQARDWLESIVEDLNKSLSQRDVAEVKESIKYLEEQINNTNVSDLKQLFYGMIESQTSKAMLAEVRSEYAFRVIDPAIAPEFKLSPQRLVITLKSVIYSLILIIVLSVLLYINNYKKQRDSARKKVESTIQDMERVNDIILEVNSNVNRLSNQIRKYEKHIKLKNSKGPDANVSIDTEEFREMISYIRMIEKIKI
mgnify:CR=1 FL=1